MNKKRLLTGEEINDLLEIGTSDTGKYETYDIVAVLLAYGFSVSLNKVRIIKYILNNPNMSMNKISKELKIDYKNTWRIIQELQKIKVLESDEVSQGKKAKIKIRNENNNLKNKKQL